MDGIFGIGPLELVLIAVIALIVLGPERLPSVMREGARYLREIRKMGNELTSQFGDELKVLEEIDPRRIINDALDPKHDEAKPTSKPAAPKPSAATAPAAAPPNAPAAAPVSVAAMAGSENGHGAASIARDDEPVNSILPPSSPAAGMAPPAPTQPAPAQPLPAETHATPPPENPA